MNKFKFNYSFSSLILYIDGLHACRKLKYKDISQKVDTREDMLMYQSNRDTMTPFTVYIAQKVQIRTTFCILLIV